MECSLYALFMKCHIGGSGPDDANNKTYDKRLTGANLYTNTDQVIALAFL